MRSERVVFGRPIGAEPGRAVPDRRAHAQMRAAALMVAQGGERCSTQGASAAPRRTWRSCSPPRRHGRGRTCASQTHGGFGFAEEYDIERKFRETRLYQVAPISTNLILSYLGEHVLGMPRSF